MKNFHGVPASISGGDRSVGSRSSRRPHYLVACGDGNGKVETLEVQSDSFSSVRDSFPQGSKLFFKNEERDL